MAVSYFDLDGYTEIVQAIADYYDPGRTALDGVATEQYIQTWANVARELESRGVTADNYYAAIERIANDYPVTIEVNRTAGGTPWSFTIKQDVGSGSGQTSVLTNSNLQPAVSNSSNTYSLSIPATFDTIDYATTGKVTLKGGIGLKADTGVTVPGVITTVSAATLAVSAGAKLGKVISKGIYEWAPDIFGVEPMMQYNPENWSIITDGQEGLGVNIINALLGIDPETNDSQLYLPEEALAYGAAYLNSVGMFATEQTASTDDEDVLEKVRSFTPPYRILKPPFSFTDLTGNTFTFTVTGVSDATLMFVSFRNGINAQMFAASKESGGLLHYHIEYSGGTSTDGSRNISHTSTFKSGDTRYYTEGGLAIPVSVIPSNVPLEFTTESESDVSGGVSWIMLYGDIERSSLPGTSDQPGAQLPAFVDVSDPETALQELKDQYPDWWDDAIYNDLPTEDGDFDRKVYIPVPLPNITDLLNPTTGAGSQADPTFHPGDADETLLDAIAELLGTPKSDTESGTGADDPTTTGSTGTGSSPSVVIPTGSASSLWAVYNPTQAQVDSFGSWLWSSDFVDQLKKLFSDPMQAIIGLHKVFATPSTGGSQSIKVGYLDSGVSSAVVTNQYTTVNCGSLYMQELFGNVFDYDPYTKIDLYLPFIGIVRLNTGDVMRGKISVTYHVDVLTGACLAEVKLERDTASGVIYTYTGNCSVQYPVSSGSYMGIVSSLLSIAGGVVGTVASGGALAPVALGALGSVGSMHTNVEKSGTISGNAGAMGIKKPYLIITRSYDETARRFSEYSGKPTNTTLRVGSCDGFVRFKYVHVSGLTATNEEKNMIESILKTGVIV